MDITSLISSDIEGGYIIKASSLTTNGAGGVYGGMMTGFIIINNTSDTSKTYYLLSGLAKGNVSSTITIGNNASENAVVGIQLPEK